MYLLEEYIKILDDKQIAFITCYSDGKRASIEEKYSLLNRYNRCERYVIKYDYEKDAIECEMKWYSLQGELSKFIEEIIDSKIIIDISLMDIRVLGALLYQLKTKMCKNVFCMYSEPLSYVKNQDEEDNYNSGFELFVKCRGVEPIPGLLRENYRGLSERWVVFLGFEQKRISQLHEDNEFNSIVPVITLPSIKPHWYNTVIDENREWLKVIERKPDYVPANSFLAVYKYLEEMINTQNDMYLKVSPLGTKINALGVLLFALNHKKNFEVLYDNPVPKATTSEDIGKTYIYDISEVLENRGENG